MDARNTRHPSSPADPSWAPRLTSHLTEEPQGCLAVAANYGFGADMAPPSGVMTIRDLASGLRPASEAGKAAIVVIASRPPRRYASAGRPDPHKPGRRSPARVHPRRTHPRASPHPMPLPGARPACPRYCHPPHRRFRWGDPARRPQRGIGPGRVSVLTCRG